MTLDGVLGFPMPGVLWKLALYGNAFGLEGLRGQGMWKSFVESIRETMKRSADRSGRVGKRRRGFAKVSSGLVAEALEVRCLPAVLPMLTVSDVVVSETDTDSAQARVVLSLDRACTEAVSFRLQTRNRTAIAGVDYTAVNAVFTIPVGGQSITVPIEIRGDLRDELSESFDVVLSSPKKATIIRSTALVTIEDNDRPPEISLSGVDVTEGGVAFVTAQLNAVSNLPVSFRVTTQSETAFSGMDFLPINVVYTIPAGLKSLRIPIATVNDVIDEATESFTIAALNPINGTVQSGSVRVTIIDNDAPPSLSVAAATIKEGNQTAALGTVRITLSSVSGLPVSFSLSYRDRLAKSGIDYSPLYSVFTIQPGQKSVDVPVTVFGNTQTQPDRAFSVEISGLQNATSLPGSVLTTTVTIDDDDGTALPLFSASDLKYLGAFRLPSGPNGASTFEFSGNALAWNPASGSLFTGANVDYGLHIAEFQVPAKLGTSSNPALLPEAAVLQPFADLGSLLTTDAGGLAQSPELDYLNLNIGGLLVTQGGLTGGMFMGYRGENPEESTHTHFRTTTTNLSELTTSTFRGLLDIRPEGSEFRGRLLGGYMAEVPAQWRDWIGASFVTGAAGLNRIQSSSSGPALFGFDANAPEHSMADPLVYYPYGNALQWMDPVGKRLAAAQPLFNGTTKVEGVAFVPGTRSVIFLGSNGLTQIGYGIGSEFRDKARVYKGYHAQNGVYKYQIWSYDIDDFVSVRNGTKAPWQIRPTTVMNFDLPTPEPSKYLGGTAFDPATGRLFVSQRYAGVDYTPVIHVYQLGRAATQRQASGTLSALSVPVRSNQTNLFRETDEFFSAGNASL